MKTILFSHQVAALCEVLKDRENIQNERVEECEIFLVARERFI